MALGAVIIGAGLHVLSKQSGPLQGVLRSINSLERLFFSV